MKKIVWLFPLVLAACGSSSGTSPAGPAVLEPRPQIDFAACDELKYLAKIYSGMSTIFYANTLVLAMQDFASKCSPQEAVAMLDSKLSIECDTHVCVVKEK